MTPSTRAALSGPAQAAVDGFLKALKALARALGALVDAHAAERAVLERLFYKGRNQHGGGLLWARVREARRYAARLERLALVEGAGRVKGAFYAEEASAKSMRGAWTHFPDAAVLRGFLERLRDAVELTEKAADAMQRVFAWAMLAVRTGEFLQTTLVLAALAARLRHLNAELAPLARAMHESARGVFGALYPGEANNVKPLDQTTEEAPPVPTSSDPLPTAHGTLEDAMDLDEDLGVSIPSTAILSEPQPVAPTVHPADAPAADRPAAVAPAPAVSLKPAAVVLNTKRKPLAPPAEPEKKAKKKKKKAKRDEIDDIFG